MAIHAKDHFGNLTKEIIADPASNDRDIENIFFQSNMFCYRCAEHGDWVMAKQYPGCAGCGYDPEEEPEPICAICKWQSITTRIEN